jgi:hypothetical protein
MQLPHVRMVTVSPLYLIHHCVQVQVYYSHISVEQTMSSPSHVPSLSSGSMRSSIIRRLIPRGFHLAPDQSDTNSTMTGIPGPGRIVGTMISRAGRRFERGVDRFAEEQLGLGPNAAALRLTSALHDVHVSNSDECRNDFDTSINRLSHVTDRLIWACNGYCSQCYAAYLPQVLTELPGPGLKAILQLIKYLQ